MKDILYYQMNSEYLPKIKYINKVTVEPPHIHIRRKTDEFILYYTLSGEMHINEGNRQYILKSDDLLILDPNLEHFGTKSTTCTYFYIHFYHNKMIEFLADENCVKDTLIDLRLNSLMTRNSESKDMLFYDIIIPKKLHIEQSSTSSNIVNLLQSLRNSHHNHLEHFQINTSSIFIEFLILISRELTSSFLYHDITTSKPRSTRMINELLCFLENNYSSHINGKSIEDNFNCSFDYINRMFKKTTGLTIFVYLNELRIFKAKQLLYDGTVKITEVAEKSGFRDVYYFSKVFKKYTGITPGNYCKTKR